MPKGIYVRTAETRANISASRVGCRSTAEARVNMSVAHLGHIESPETRMKISTSRMGNKYALGCHRSEETKARISVARWTGGRVIANKRRHAKRRLMGYVFLNKWFAGCDGHHIDNEQIINMPRKLHRGKGNYHNHKTGQGMARMNAIAYNYLFKEEVRNALSA